MNYNRKTYTYTLLVDATSAVEADAIVNNILAGKTFAHEVNAVAWERISAHTSPLLKGDVR